jgi:FkbM family methyltransferase
MRIKEIIEIINHPSNKNGKIKSIINYLRWNIGRRVLSDTAHIIKLTENCKVILTKNENYATLAYTCGLYDFQEMNFLLNYLRKGDVFGDFGANVGVYSIIAGSAGALAIAIEPVPNTFARLKENLLLNETKSIPINCGLGETSEFLNFTTDSGGLNRVATLREIEDDRIRKISVEIKTADIIAQEIGLYPCAIKIDVEGFELRVLRGAAELLTKHVNVAIIELNGSGTPYGHTDQDVHEFLINRGFSSYSYNSETKELHRLESIKEGSMNQLYIKNSSLQKIASRIKSP